MVIPNGITEEDHDTGGFSKAFHDQYSKVKEAFEGGDPVLLMFKNITTLQSTINY